MSRTNITLTILPTSVNTANDPDCFGERINKKPRVLARGLSEDSASSQNFNIRLARAEVVLNL